jgi:hypothetical protein
VFDAEIRRVEGFIPWQEDAFQGTNLTEGVGASLCFQFSLMTPASNNRLSQYDSDVEDKLSPSIQYLQKLGPEYIDQVFSYAGWIFDMDSELA